MLSPEDQYSASKTASVFQPLSQHLIFRISGPDTVRYLQGRTTQNIQKIDCGSSANSLLLNPQGKIQGRFLAARTAEEEFLLIADPGLSENPLEHFSKCLLQFKVADAVELEPLIDSHSAVLLSGATASDVLKSVGISEPPTLPNTYQSHSIADLPCSIVSIHFLEQCAFILIFETEHQKTICSALESHGAIAGSTDGYNLLRVLSGIPEVGTDLNEKTIATEIDVSELVAFDKGCYAGQEVVEMSIARGRPNRIFYQFESELNESIQVGAEILPSSNPDKTCGTITSMATLPKEGKCLALGFVKSKIPEDEEISAHGSVLKRL